MKIPQRKWGYLVKNSSVSELSELFHDIEFAKDTLLEVDPNTERSMTIHQRINNAHSIS